MAKRRSVWGDASTSEKVNSISDQAALLWYMCIAWFDRDGLLEAETHFLKYKITPMRSNFTKNLIETWRQEIIDVGLWELLQDPKGKLVAKELAFNEHQTIRRDKEAPSKWEGIKLTPVQGPSKDGPTPVLLPPYSGPTPVQGRSEPQPIEKNQLPSLDGPTPVLGPHEVKDKAEVKVKDKINIKTSFNADHPSLGTAEKEVPLEKPKTIEEKYPFLKERAEAEKTVSLKFPKIEEEKTTTPSSQLQEAEAFTAKEKAWTQRFLEIQKKLKTRGLGFFQLIKFIRFNLQPISKEDHEGKNLILDAIDEMLKVEPPIKNEHTAETWAQKSAQNKIAKHNASISEAESQAFKKEPTPTKRGGPPQPIGSILGKITENQPNPIPEHPEEPPK